MSNSREITHDQVDDGSLSLLLRLPSEIIVQILLFLPATRKQLVSVALSCHALFNIANDKTLLRRISRNYYKPDSVTAISTPYIPAFAVSPSGKYFATCEVTSIYHSYSQIKLYDAKSGQIIHKNNDIYRDGSYYSLTFLNNEKYLVAINCGHIDIYDLADLASDRPRYSYPKKYEWKTPITIISENEFIFINDRKLYLCDFKNNNLIHINDIPTSSLKQVTMHLSVDGGHLIITSPNDRLGHTLDIRILDIETKVFIKDVSTHYYDHYNWDFNISKDGENLLYSYQSDHARRSIGMINIDELWGMSLLTPITRFSSFTYYKSADIFTVREILDDEGHEGGFHIFDANTLKQIGYIPTDLRFAKLHMSPTGDRLFVVNRERPDFRDPNIGGFTIYKFNRRDLNNEVTEDCEIATIKPF